MLFENMKKVLLDHGFSLEDTLAGEQGMEEYQNTHLIACRQDSRHFIQFTRVHLGHQVAQINTYTVGDGFGHMEIDCKDAIKQIDMLEARDRDADEVHRELHGTPDQLHREIYNVSRETINKVPEGSSDDQTN